MKSNPLRVFLSGGPALLGLIWLLTFAPVAVADPLHPWLARSPTASDQLLQRIAPPKGFQRVHVRRDSFAYWLRRLPLKPSGSAVYLFNGQLKFNQNAHMAVIDIDVGKRDLQQCADAVMRLRAEYLYAKGRDRDIHFNFTGGTKVPFLRWTRGERPRVRGRHISWRRGARRGRDRKNFKRYMRMIYAYAGTYSLARELGPVKLDDMQGGDVFIKGGFPGHAVLVVDVVENPATGERRFLLLQSFMPAQDMHVLKNPNSVFASPWYKLPTSRPANWSTSRSSDPPTGQLITPEWAFAWTSLKRFGR